MHISQCFKSTLFCANYLVYDMARGGLLPRLTGPAGISEEVAQELSEDPAVVGVGIDTASIDRGVSEEPAAHVILASANRFNLENLGDMSRVPATGARLALLCKHWPLPDEPGGLPQLGWFIRAWNVLSLG